MYDNNDNYGRYSQGNMSSSSNDGYQEYFYSTGSNYGRMADAAPKKKGGGFFKKAIVTTCLGLIFGLTASAVFSLSSYMNFKELNKAKAALEAVKNATGQAQAGGASESQNSSSIKATTLTPSNASYAGNSGTISAIAQNCLPSVVSITNKGVTEVQTFFGTYIQDTEGSGSGIIIGENDTELLIVTNYHVVSGSKELSVVFSYDEDSENPTVVSAKMKGYDSDKDLAVIAVPRDNITDEMRSQIKIATIGDSSNLQLGQEVVAIGNALGYGQSVTRGIISALNREVTVSDDKGQKFTNKLIQTDAAINPGNSGGALLNMNGELIGINSVKVSSSSVEGMGYAIPISDVSSIIDELVLYGSRDVVAQDSQGYLGIGGVDVTAEISESYDMPEGVYINTIYDNSPANAAGLSKGDIIVKFDGRTVKSMSELKSLLTYYKAGETVDIIAMVRGNGGYTEQKFTLTLGTKDIFGSEEYQVPNNNNQYSPSDPYDFFRSIP